MNKTKVKALLVEDSAIVARFMTEALELEEGSNIEIIHTNCLADAAKTLKERGSKPRPPLLRHRPAQMPAAGEQFGGDRTRQS